jgi:large-conductance mechanosensitive channel
MVVKLINKAQEKVIKKQKAEEKKEILKKADDVILLEEIRDLLKANK